MPSLKSLRTRIKSIKATQKITSAMKMVAAAKLRRAQEKAESARPYTHQLAQLLNTCLKSYEGQHPSLFLTERNKSSPHLFVICTSDRGLCGGFNSTLIRAAHAEIKKSQEKGEDFRLFILGKKGRDQLARDYPGKLMTLPHDLDLKELNYEVALTIGSTLESWLKEEQVGQISLIYSFFKTVLTQIVTVQPLAPFSLEKEILPLASQAHAKKLSLGGENPWYTFEPSLQELTDQLLFSHFISLIHRSLLETRASELGARMTAMDNATRNARDVIKDLELTYNRTRQAYITKELIEIISGAEAL